MLTFCVWDVGSIYLVWARLFCWNVLVLYTIYGSVSDLLKGGIKFYKYLSLFYDDFPKI